MGMTAIMIAAAVVGIVGILIGLLLGVASEKFKVEVNEKEVAVREALPGNNCGGCGYPGCDGLAKAIANGDAPVNKCPVGGAPVAAIISEIMGVSAEDSQKMVAFVKCKGTCDKTRQDYTYFGISDCNSAMSVPGQSGGKSCSYGCMGFGSCVKACEFDSIHIVDGIALVNRETCVACGKCVDACPKKLIDLVPYETYTFVQCNSQDKGKAVKDKCQVGCISCQMCVRACESDAIHMNGNVALIQYENCINCGKCAAKCPTKVIQVVDGKLALTA